MLYHPDMRDFMRLREKKWAGHLAKNDTVNQVAFSLRLNA